MTQLPASVIGGLTRYRDDRIPTGGFLRAVLEDDLAGAVGSADDINRPLIPDIVNWCWNNLPSECWGTKQRVTDWLNGEELR